MRLSPRELEGLLIHQTGFLAQKRLARGLKLNHPEAVALIACQVSAQYARRLLHCKITEFHGAHFVLTVEKWSNFRIPSHK